MKASVLLLSILGLSLVGCTSHTYTKESVIEKPVASEPARVVVEQPPPREIIVEKQVVAPPRSCVMGSSTFNHGSMSCQAGYQYRCDDGHWLNSGALC